MLYLFLVISLGVVSPIFGQNRFCRSINRMDCSKGFAPTLICGSDGVTYPNDCEFSKAMCKNPNLKENHKGACIIPTTTPEPTTELVTEPTTEPTTELVTEPTTEPTTELVTEPTTEPTTELVTEPTTEPTTEQVTEPTTELVTEPTTEPTTEQATEPTTELVTEPTTEPTTELMTEPTTKPTTEPMTKLVTEPTTEPTTEQITEPTTELVRESTSESVSEGLTPEGRITENVTEPTPTGEPRTEEPVGVSVSAEINITAVIKLTDDPAIETPSTPAGESSTPTTENVPTTTPRQISTFPFNPIVESFLCTWIDEKEVYCDGSHKDYACASDHHTYRTRCDLIKARCDFPNLHMVQAGICPGHKLAVEYTKHEFVLHIIEDVED